MKPYPCTGETLRAAFDATARSKTRLAREMGITPRAYNRYTSERKSVPPRALMRASERLAALSAEIARFADKLKEEASHE